MEFGLQIVHLGFGRGQFRRIIGLRDGIPGSRRAGRNQNLSQRHALRPRVLLLVRLEVALRLAGGEHDLPPTSWRITSWVMI